MTNIKSRLAISNIAWKPEDTEAVYAFLQQQGITNLEIAPSLFIPNVEAPYEVSDDILMLAKQKCDDYGLKLVSMQSLLFGSSGLFLFEDEESRKRLLNYCKKSIAFASKLGIGNLVFGSPKNRVIPKGMSQAEAISIAKNFFNELGDYALKYNTCIGLEANSKAYGCNFLSNTKDTVAFIKDLNNDGVKLNFDLSTFIWEDESKNVLSEALTHANHVHISVPYLNPIYELETTIHEYLKEALERSSYNGAISIEMKSSEDLSGLKHVAKALETVGLYYF